MYLSNIEYKTGKANKVDIFNHLQQCDDYFAPKLSSYVDVNSYSKKLFINARTFEAWNGDKLIGLIACYCNDKKKGKAYVSNVSVVKEFQGTGIAQRLLEQTIIHMRSLNFKSIELEVYEGNKAALNLYTLFKFKKEISADKKIKMRLVL